MLEDLSQNVLERAKTLATAFDEALGSPPFDNPSEAAFLNLKEFHQALMDIEKGGLLDKLKDVEEIVYTFPILCAAVREGSTTVDVSFYRLLIRSLLCIIPIVKYPLDAIVKSSEEVLGFEDPLLFHFLLYTKTLTTDHLLKFLCLPSPHTMPLKKKKKNSSSPAVTESTKVPPQEILFAIIPTPFEEHFRCIVLSCFNAPDKFERVTHGNRELATLAIEMYGKELLSVLHPHSLLLVLCAQNCYYFIELLEKQSSLDFISNRDHAMRMGDILDDSTIASLCEFLLTPPCVTFFWGLLCARCFLYECIITYRKRERQLDHFAVELLQRIFQQYSTSSFRNVGKSFTADTKDEMCRSALHTLTEIYPSKSVLTLSAHSKEDLKAAASELRLSILEDVKLTRSHAVKNAMPRGNNKRQNKGKGKDKGNSSRKDDSSQEERKEDKSLKEHSLQQFMSILFFLEEIIQKGELIAETLILLVNTIDDFEKTFHQQMSTGTYLLFLRIVELFGRTSRTLPTFANENSLLQMMIKGFKSTADLTWLLSYLTPGKISIRKCVENWPPFFVGQIFLTLCKENCLIRGAAPSAVAVRLLCIIHPKDHTSILQILYGAGSLKALEFMIKKGLADIQNTARTKEVEEAKNILLFVQRFAKEKEEEQAEAERREIESRGAQLQEKLRIATELAQRSATEEKMRAEREAAYIARQEQIRAVLAERREAQQRKKDLAAQQREQQRQYAMDLSKKMKHQSDQEKENEKRRRLKEYKEASLRAFRASTFLHSLGISTSQVMKILDEVVTKNPKVTPDDLLEYIVTGTPSIPSDMIDDSNEEDSLDVIEEPRRPEKSFWDEVLEGSKTEVRPPPIQEVHFSFHYRIKHLMDLFCYEGGDAMGTLPVPLPRISIKLAKKLLEPQKLWASGFRTVEEAFLEMERRKLVRIRNETAEITVLGFRYHFPFHEPEGMLDVLIRLQKEKALLSLASRRAVRKEAEEMEVAEEASPESDSQVSELAEEEEYEEWDSEEDNDTV